MGKSNGRTESILIPNLFGMGVGVLDMTLPAAA